MMGDDVAGEHDQVGALALHLCDAPCQVRFTVAKTEVAIGQMSDAQSVEFGRQRRDAQGHTLQDRARRFSQQHMPERSRAESTACRSDGPAKQIDPCHPCGGHDRAKPNPSPVNVQFGRFDRLAPTQRSTLARTNPDRVRFVRVCFDWHVVFLCCDE